jgi:pimeloyl-ACP methyl ester carboxylesterase
MNLPGLATTSALILLASLPSAGTAAAADPTGGGRAIAHYCANRDAYEFGRCAASPALPPIPLSGQLRWLLDQAGGGATTLTEAEAAGHFSAEYLQVVMPPARVVEALRSVITEVGVLTFAGFSFPPRADQAVVLTSAAGGQRIALAAGVDSAGRLEYLQFQFAPPTVVPRGPYSGMVRIGGRNVFLRCTGHGSPTVVFELGQTTDWFAIQNSLAATTRVCSYDLPNANGPFSRSEPAPTPRTAADIVTELHTMLATAGVPGPYVLAGFSNGGLYSLLYASRYPSDVAGLVLIDGVHPDYYARRLAMLKQLLPPDAYAVFEREATTALPRLLDPEQIDIVTSQAQTRAALAAHPLRPMPLAVLTHGIPAEDRPDWPNAEDEALWLQLQDELAALEPGSTHLIAAGSDHDIPLNRPDLVIAQVTRVVHAARTARN